MKVAFLSPLPPSRTGIAHYASMVLPALRAKLDVTGFPSIDGYRRDAFDAAIYQLGNNPHHEWIYREAHEHPGIVVLHDMVLHHLIVEMTLARGNVDGYVAALTASHGPMGAAWARGRAAGLHDELANFLLPASIDLANRSSAAIVHNRWAAERLRSFGVRVPIHVVPHPIDPSAFRVPEGTRALRERLGISDSDRVIGLFGFLTSAKRGEVVLEAFRRVADGTRKLLIVGEVAPNIDPEALNMPGVITTGWVPDDEFGAYYAIADRLVNLRYPSAGETSGTVLRAFAAGKPVAVSDYAQFAVLPPGAATHIPLGEGEADALAAFFQAELDETSIARAQREWLEANARIDQTVEGYLAALQGAPADSESFDLPAVPREPASLGGIPLFPQLKVMKIAAASLTVRNVGEGTLLTRTYDQPCYRLLAKSFDATGAEVGDRWIELPCDLAPGEEVTVPLPFAGGTTVRLHHALEGVPMLEPEPWFVAPV